MHTSIKTMLGQMKPKDHDADDVVRVHYDCAAARRGSAAARAEGPAYPLKRFHNQIKEAMIRAFAPPGSSLCDVCCGRGGDLQKWARAGLARVRGIDVSEEAIANARQRLSTIAGPGPDVTFEVRDMRVPSAADHDNKFDCVSCFFAIHYFFESERTLYGLLGFVAQTLRPGGIFFGACPDGRRVVEKATRRGNNVGGHNDKTNVLRLEGQWGEGPPAAFGSRYLMEIKDTVTEATEAGTHNVEYLVFESVLKKAAMAHGLVPVDPWPRLAFHSTNKSNTSRTECLGPVSTTHGLFRPFAPSMRATRGVAHGAELDEASGLFVAFAFRKVSKIITK
jgi:SAM-dependent methyltransferase